MFPILLNLIAISFILEMLDTKRQEVFEELQHIEERMKRNFEPKKNKEEEIEKEPSIDTHDESMDAEPTNTETEITEAAPEEIAETALTSDNNVVEEEQSKIQLQIGEKPEEIAVETDKQQSQEEITETGKVVEETLEVEKMVEQ